MRYTFLFIDNMHTYIYIILYVYTCIYMHLVVFVCVIICLFKIIVQHDDMSCQFMYHLHPCYVAMCDSIDIPMNQHKLFMVFDKYYPAG